MSGRQPYRSIPCLARAGRRLDESDVGSRWPATRQRTCGPVRNRNHDRHRDRDREREADEFYADLARPRSTPEENRVLRQAFAGMLWGMQYCWRREARAATGQRRERGPSAVLVDQSRQHDPEHEHEDTDEHERATHDRSTARCRLDGRPDGRARDRTYWCCVGHQARTMKPAANRSLSLAGHKRCSCRSCPGLPRTCS